MTSWGSAILEMESFVDASLAEFAGVLDGVASGDLALPSFAPPVGAPSSDERIRVGAVQRRLEDLVGLLGETASSVGVQLAAMEVRTAPSSTSEFDRRL